MTASAPERAPARRPPTDSIPLRVQVAAAWAWRVGLLVAVALGLLFLVAQAGFVVYAVVAATLLSAVLQPLVARLRAAGVPRLVAATGVFVGFLAVLVGLLWLIGRQLADQFEALGTSVQAGLIDLRNQATRVLPVSAEQLDGYADQAVTAVQDNAGALLGGLGTATGTVGTALGGLFLALFVTFFMLSDGRGMWNWVVGLFPRGYRAAIDPAGGRAWGALVGYMRGLIAVALADATLIGIALLILGVPLVLPLAVLTFLGAFIPLIGATLAGVTAVLVALVTQGPVTALILVGVVFAVQWLDSDLLQPLIIGRTIHLHPVAVALAISTGTVIAGIGGTIAAVPLVAAIYAAARPREHEDDPPQEPAQSSAATPGGETSGPEGASDSPGETRSTSE
ncbi:MAG: AI-2E family transporter [Actinomycetota bacterium]|nr:AI-2E family transporter [Actinomycetota bacterium]